MKHLNIVLHADILKPFLKECDMKKKGGKKEKNKKKFLEKKKDRSILEMMRITSEIIVEERAKYKEKKIIGDEV